MRVLLGLAIFLASTDALPCSSLLECPTDIGSEPSTDLARLAYSAVKSSMSIGEVTALLGPPTAVTLPGDRDENGEFELSIPEEEAVLWYANGECGPIAIQF